MAQPSKKSKGFRHYLIFPITYLILELVEEFIYYKSELIADPWVRTAAVMVGLVCGISLLAFILVPFFEGGLDTIRKSHKNHGVWVDFLVTFFILAALYYIYHLKIHEGFKNVLPPFLLN